MGYNYYAVRKGNTPGIYTTWDECKKQINGFKGQEYKGFNNLSDAESYMGMISSQTLPSTRTPIIDTPNDVVIAYTDGSFSDKVGKYGAGGIIVTDGYEFSFCGCENHMIGMRNVAGEIEAARHVMEYAIRRKCKYLRLYYDYEGVEKWCTGVWSANKQGTQEYRDYYNSIRDILRIEFIHVDSHSGDKYNDIADTLAKRSVGL